MQVARDEVSRRDVVSVSGEQRHLVSALEIPLGEESEQTGEQERHQHDESAVDLLALLLPVVSSYLASWESKIADSTALL